MDFECDKRSSNKDQTDNLSEVLALTDRVMNNLNDLPVKSHADIVKKIGVLMLVFTATFCLVSIVTVIFTPHSTSVKFTDFNLLNCTKKFPLSESLYAIVCQGSDLVTVDIGRFFGNHRTEYGVRLNMKQWTYLKRSVDLIDRCWTIIQKIKG